MILRFGLLRTYYFGLLRYKLRQTFISSPIQGYVFAIDRRKIKVFKPFSPMPYKINFSHPKIQNKDIIDINLNWNKNQLFVSLNSKLICNVIRNNVKLNKSLIYAFGITAKPIKSKVELICYDYNIY